RAQRRARDVFDVAARGVPWRPGRGHAARHALQLGREAPGVGLPRRASRREALQMTGRLTGRRGFTLIEVIVSMSLLAVVLMSLARVSTAITVRARTTDVVARRMSVLQLEA